jgi:hypothetical protein
MIQSSLEWAVPTKFTDHASGKREKRSVAESGESSFANARFQKV